MPSMKLGGQNRRDEQTGRRDQEVSMPSMKLGGKTSMVIVKLVISLFQCQA